MAFALEAFRLCAANIDAAEQTHAGMSSFEAAMDVVRESNDFCLSVEGMRNPQIQCVISKHKTVVLKARDCQELSAREAAFQYITFTRCELVKSANGIPEAGEALMLLGAAESGIVGGDLFHGDAITAMLQAAVIDITPEDYKPHSALGITLSRQSLSEQARLSIQRSLELKPTQLGYQGLIELAMQS